MLPGCFSRYTTLGRETHAGKGMANTYHRRNDTIESFLERLADRLRTYRKTYDFSLEELAEELGYANKSSIARLENNDSQPSIEVLARLSQLYKCALSDLIGELEEEPASGWLTFVRRLPHSNLLTAESRSDIQHGIDVLRGIIDGKKLDELYELPGLSRYRGNREVLFAFLRTALVSGEIIFTQIPFATALEERLVKKYPQLRGAAHVVDLSRTDISEALPPELVAWAAAHYVMPELRQPSRVGFGYGYTLHRMCRLAPPSVEQFLRTRWIPLMAFSGEEDAIATSANHQAAFMQQHHYFSEAVHLPYVPPDERASHPGLENIRRHWEQLNVALVSGFGWNKAINHRVASSYRQIYRRLEDSGQIDTVVGEFLGYILDKNGNSIIEEETDKATTRIPLEDIRRCAQEDKVYFVGYGVQKAPVVRVILKKGYISGLVTDSGIAEELLAD